MFTTYDVHFYASFALIMNWPQIQLTIQRDYIKSIYYEYDEEYRWCGSGNVSKRKLKGCVPHDLGTTAEDPFFKVNSYHIQDTNRWKDLNCMFVLLVYRDYHITKDEKYLREAFPAVIEVIDYHLHNFDKDGDGLIENEGFPDSTYDAWVCTGPSAFCGGLWISALFCAHKMAGILGDAANEQRLLNICNEATASYEQKLWNPNGYYNYDANANQDRTYMSDTVMSDQLCGHTFLRACQLPSLLKPERVSSALQKIYKLNVMKYREITGNGGAVNGMRPTGEIDTSLMQCKEVWTGTSYLLASCMLHEGMREEAFDIARGVYETCMRLGYWFQTPEAYHENGAYRSLGYMRPLSIWSIQLAHQQHQKQQ
jgi:non-lysosomal glucosylceramidase